jgi:hypothetical protein
MEQNTSAAPTTEVPKKKVTFSKKPLPTKDTTISTGDDI